MPALFTIGSQNSQLNSISHENLEQQQQKSPSQKYSSEFVFVNNFQFSDDSKQKLADIMQFGCGRRGYCQNKYCADNPGIFFLSILNIFIFFFSINLDVVPLGLNEIEHILGQKEWEVIPFCDDLDENTTQGSLSTRNTSQKASQK